MIFYNSTKAMMNSTISYLFLAMLLILVLYGAYDVFADDSSIEDTALARDVALSIDAMQSSSRDIYYAYPDSFLDKSLFTDGSVVTVTKNSSTDKDTSESSLAYFTSYKFNPSTLMSVPSDFVLKKIELTLQKEGNQLFFSKEKLSTENKNSPSVQTQSTTSRKEIIFDIKSSENTQHVISQISRKLEAELERKGFTIDKQKPDIILQFEKKEDGKKILFGYDPSHEQTTKEPTTQLHSYFKKVMEENIGSQPYATKPQTTARILITIPESYSSTQFSQDESIDTFIERFAYALGEYYPE
ncbi:MAG: hypothetical protein ACQESC_01805 [Nanobdellota archaeon]